MDRVIVQGSGPVGLLAAILARLSGALQVRLSLLTQIALFLVFHM
jgi:threonine dehydrogenase-like Zn-dependent dehydrogenase